MKTRIEQLRERIREVTGEDPIFGSSPDFPPDIEEAFLEKVLAFEMSPRRVLADLLGEAGVELPQPDELDQKKVTAKLWEVIHALLARAVVIGNTDHLDDRELYTLLWKEFLHEEYVISPNHMIEIDIARTGPHDGIPVYLKYYATETERRHYAKANPNFDMPKHVDPPRRRDHLIPANPNEQLD